MKAKVSRRHFLRAAGTFSSGALLAACGATPAAPEQGAVAQATTAPAPTTAIEPTAATAVEPTATTVEAMPTAMPEPTAGAPATGAGETFWFHTSNETESRRPAVEKFFADNYPDMEVRIDVTPSGFFEKVLAQIASGDVPDVIYMHEAQVLNFARQDALLPIDDYLASQPLIGDASKYPIDLFRRDSAYQGKLHAMPMGFAVLMLRYNKTMFDEAGAPVPTDKWTWDDLRTTAAKLTKDTNGDDTPDQWGWIGWLPDWMPSWWPLLKSYGGTHFTDGLKESALSEEGGVAALDFMRSTWCGDQRSSPAPAVRQQLMAGTVQLFEGGLAAMDYILSQNVGSALKAIDGKFEMGLELFPAGPKGRFVRTGGTSYAMPTGATNADIGWELIRWLAGDEEANRLAATYENGNPLIHLDHVLKYNAPEGALAEPWRRIVTDGFQQYGTVVQYAPIGEYGQFVASSMDKLAACDITAEEAAAEIADSTNQQLLDVAE